MVRLATLFFLATIIHTAPVSADENESCQAMFVQSSGGMAFDGQTLTMKRVDPNIIYFCDRPVREAGHLHMDVFLNLVSKGKNSFAENPPNAALSVFGDGKAVTEAVVTLLKRPTSDGLDLHYAVKVLGGDIPATGGPAVLFIDPRAMHMRPTSRAGVHRRHHRRAVRRCENDDKTRVGYTDGPCD